jgi:rsbT co-antagonist protein RsbR
MKADISQLLQTNKGQILEQWIANQLAEYSLKEYITGNESFRIQSEQLLDVLVSTVNDRNIGQPESSDFDSVNDVLAGISNFQARQGFTPRETGLYILSLKESILHLLQQQITDDPSVLYQLSMQFTKLVDFFSITTFETFLQGREDVILRQNDEIAEISTPVIRVWDGILALPIIGTLDSSRTQVVMENLLQQIVESGSSIAILDISGVPAVDSLVAQHLIKTVSATRLMGAECIISGIRPEIAQTVVQLGIDLSSITTKATLASALRHAFAMLRLEVKKVTKD